MSDPAAKEAFVGKVGDEPEMREGPAGLRNLGATCYVSAARSSAEPGKCLPSAVVPQCGLPKWAVCLRPGRGESTRTALSVSLMTGVETIPPSQYFRVHADVPAQYCRSLGPRQSAAAQRGRATGRRRVSELDEQCLWKGSRSCSCRSSSKSWVFSRRQRREDWSGVW